MKKTIIPILFSVFCVLCSIVHAANEIRAFVPGATGCFAVVREIDGDVYYIVGDAFEIWGGGVGRTAADYDIAMVDKSAGMFVGDMDTNIGAGQYYIVTHQDNDSAPVDADPAIWQEYGDWDGSTWTPATITPAVIADAVWDELSTGHVDAGKAGQQQWTDVDAILDDTGELQTDWTDGGRLDLLIDAIKYKTDLITILDTTVKAGVDANNFTLTAGIDVNDALWFHTIMVTDGDDGHGELRTITDYLHNTGADPNILVDQPFGFTPATGDVVHVMGTDYTGLVYDMWNWLKQSNTPTYFIDATGTGASRRTGITHFDASAEDP